MHIDVVDDDDGSDASNCAAATSKPASASPDRVVWRYNAHQLQSVLQFMGCKQLRAVRITDSVFEKVAQRQAGNSQPVPLSVFLAIVGDALNGMGYTWPALERDFRIAQRIKDQRQSLCILLGGTSGCGKSTLGSLVASRLGVTTVLSTDNIRHLARSVVTNAEEPILFASSYNAGEVLSTAGEAPSSVSPDHLVIDGFEAQNRLLFRHIDGVIERFEKRRESVVMEGVHLSVESMKELMLRHPSCIAFLIVISNEAKHTERFAIRAKYMTLEPRLNKYVKYFAHIRTIQDYLCRQADAALIPKIDNTNVDRSLAIIHQTILMTLRYLDGVFDVEPDVAAPPDTPFKTPTLVLTTPTRPAPASPSRRLIDPSTRQAHVLCAIYREIEDRTYGSKAMLQVIRNKRRTLSDADNSAPPPTILLMESAEDEHALQIADGGNGSNNEEGTVNGTAGIAPDADTTAAGPDAARSRWLELPFDFEEGKFTSLGS